MSKVAVFNDNIYPYKENFRENIIEIPPKGHIMMDKDEAKLFLGNYSPPMLDSDGNHMEEGFKKLRILGEMKPEIKQNLIFKCTACGLECKSQNDLELHIIAKHVDQLVASTDEEIKVKEEYKKKEAEKLKNSKPKNSTKDKKFGL